VSLCGTITIKGTIDASGGGGGAIDDATCPEGAGGGAGGTVWMQAGSIVFQNGTANIQLEGGGGGGGGCRATSGDPWSAGTGASRKNPGGGATCAGGVFGGDGGAGAGTPNGPGIGSAPTPAAGEAKCGGGGGGRGRLVLQGRSCDLVPHNGICAALTK
jgi:hypothetical protein